MAKNWFQIKKDFEDSKIKLQKEKEKELEKDKLRDLFLKKHAVMHIRITNKPEFFHEINREMYGKYGWFDSYNKNYNLTEYYTGYEFSNAQDLKNFLNI